MNNKLLSFLGGKAERTTTATTSITTSYTTSWSTAVYTTTSRSTNRTTSYSTAYSTIYSYTPLVTFFERGTSATGGYVVGSNYGSSTSDGTADNKVAVKVLAVDGIGVPTSVILGWVPSNSPYAYMQTSGGTFSADFYHNGIKQFYVHIGHSSNSRSTNYTTSHTTTWTTSWSTVSYYRTTSRGTSRTTSFSTEKVTQL